MSAPRAQGGSPGVRPRPSAAVPAGRSLKTDLHPRRDHAPRASLGNSLRVRRTSVREPGATV
eukprot:CAMPEP_0116981910 /NCGR_PEP_ID=MMETSP0467-20121206/60011_1 /TAXON_ID=283647 /ORGANISM="Mesodinium pulex, Strain SPMC105" /LENGTH=61 /DNA_ID=CAMNT_0004676267 /DNA_START=30 /DNA_END=215 /DNA_ORIENTATION=+